MNFDYSESQMLFSDAVTRFLGADTIASRRALRSAPGGIDRQRWSGLAEMGLLALAVDEDKGGLGGCVLDLVVVAEAMGRGLSADGWLENGVLPLALLNAAKGVAPALLENCVNSEKLASLAFAEPQTRYSLGPKNTHAKPAEPGFLLNGDKQFVLGGMAADNFIVSALLGTETAYFIVDADNPGLHRRGYRLTDGSMAAVLELRGCAVAADARLDIHAAQCERVIALVQLLAAAELCGLGQKMLDDTLAFVRQREQFGQAIGRFQALQHRLVDCYLLDDQNRSLLLRGAMRLTANAPDAARHIAGTKALIAQNVLKIGQEAVQMHGGMGTTDEVEIGHAHKRSLLLAQFLGDPASGLAAYAKAA